MSEPTVETKSVVYVHALDCGHKTWTASAVSGGIEWCHLCGQWRGVMIFRKDAK